MDENLKIPLKVKMQTASTGKEYNIIVNGSWGDAVRVGNLAENPETNDAYGESIMVSIENLTMTESTYFYNETD